MKLESTADLFRSLRERIRKNPHERVWMYVLSNKDRDSGSCCCNSAEVLL